MRKTCHDCPHLKGAQIAMQGAVFYCEKTNAIVPHNWKEGEATFWRVPMGCPLSDDEVLKSETKAQPCDWITISVDRDKLEPVKL